MDIIFRVVMKTKMQFCRKSVCRECCIFITMRLLFEIIKGTKIRRITLQKFILYKIF